MAGKKIPIELNFYADYKDALRALRVIASYYDEFARNQNRAVEQRIKSLKRLAQVEKVYAVELAERLVGNIYDIKTPAGRAARAEAIRNIIRAHTAKVGEHISRTRSRILEANERFILEREKRLFSAQIDYYNRIYRNERSSLRRRLRAFENYKNAILERTELIAKKEAERFKLGREEAKRYVDFRKKAVLASLEQEKRKLIELAKYKPHKEAITRYQGFQRAQVELYRAQWKDTELSYQKRLEAFEKYKQHRIALERSIAREEAKRLKLSEAETKRYVAIRTQYMQELLARERKGIVAEDRVYMSSLKKRITASIDYYKAIWQNETNSLQERMRAFKRYSRLRIALTKRVAEFEAKAYKLSEIKTALYVKHQIGLVKERLAREQAEMKGQVAAGFGLWKRFFGPGGLAFTIVRSEIIFRAFYRVFMLFREALEKSLDTLEQFKITTISIAAILTSLSDVPVNKLDEYFKNALAYTQHLYDNMILLSRGTLLTTEQSMKLVEAFAMFGQVADLSSKKSLEGLRAVINAVALLTKGQRLEIQLRQEIRGLMTQTGLQFTMIYQVLKAMNPEIEKQIRLWAKNGTVIQHVGEYLRGFGVASKYLANTLRGTWTTVKSIFSQKILREAVTPLYDTLVGIGNKVLRTLIVDVDNFNLELTSSGKDLVGTFRSIFGDLAWEIKLVAGTLDLLVNKLHLLKDGFLAIQALGAGVLLRWLFNVNVPGQALAIITATLFLLEKTYHHIEKTHPDWITKVQERSEKLGGLLFDVVQELKEKFTAGSRNFKKTLEGVGRELEEVFKRMPFFSELFPETEGIEPLLETKPKVVKPSPKPKIVKPPPINREQLMRDLAAAQFELSKLSVSWKDFIDLVPLTAKQVGANLIDISSHTVSQIENMVSVSLKKLRTIYQHNISQLKRVLEIWKTTIIPKTIFQYLSKEYQGAGYFDKLVKLATTHGFGKGSEAVTNMLLRMFEFQKKRGLYITEVPTEFLRSMGIDTKKHLDLVIAITAAYKAVYNVLQSIRDIQEWINDQQTQYNNQVKVLNNRLKQAHDKSKQQQETLNQIVESEKARLENVLAEYAGRTSAEERLQHQLEAVDKETQQRISNLKKRLDALRMLLPKEKSEAIKTITEIENQIADVRKKLLREEYEETYTFIGGVKKALNDLSDSFQRTGEWIYNSLTNAFQRLEESISQLFFDALTDKMKSFKDYVTNFAKSIALAVVKIYSEYMAKLLVSSLVGNLKVRVEGGNFGFLGSVFSTIFGGLFGGGTAVPNVGTVVPEIPGEVGMVAVGAEGGIFPAKFIPLQTFAEGDVVKRPTFGLIGEAGYPEAVIPLKHGYVPVRLTNNQPNVIINVENKAGVPIDMKEVGRHFDGKSLIINTVIEALHTDHDFRSAIKQTALGGA